jgi:anti-sigma regulatory factor (Ser/Thr protein kinase)
MDSEATRCDGPAEIKVLIPPAVDARQRARHQVDALGVPAPASHDVTLLVSEVVTNCVVHAGLAPGQDIDLRLTRDGDTVRVEVRDEGQGFAESLVRGSRSNGFGLYLVERLSDRWGVKRGDRTCVWFEVDLAAA